MANKKVSQLSATTEANDGVWLIMNNSGNTETFRIKREDLLSGTTTPAGFIQGDASQSLVPYYFPTSAATAADTTYVDNLETLGSVQVSGLEKLQVGTGVYTEITNNSIKQQGSTTSAIIGATNSTTSTLSVAIAGASISISSGRSLVGVGFGTKTLNGGIANAVLSDRSIVDNSSQVGIIGGQYHNITSGNFTGMLAGSGNTITNSTLSVIIGGSGNTISGLDNVIILGGTDITATTSNTTYVNHLTSVGQINNGYYDNLSGDTFTIDWNNGNSQKVYMTGNTTLDFTNVRNGATYKLQVVNGGTHSITGATASGYTILCEGGNIPNITNNGVDLCVLEVMDTDILVRHFADFSAP